MTVQYQGVWSLQSAAQLQSTQRWVTDPLYKNTTLLLQADDAANGAQNNTFLDSSSNSFAITRNGNTTQGSFTPFSQAPGRWGNYFDGSSGISTADSADFTFGSGDFTIQCWVFSTVGGSLQWLAGQGASNAANTSISFAIQKTANNKLNPSVFTGGTQYQITSTGDLQANQWVHIAFVRDGNTCRLYINGVQDGTVSVTGVTVNDSSNQVAIGQLGEYVTNRYTGYVSNFSIIKGTCSYPSGATFTVPASPLSASATNQSFLTCTANGFIDTNTATTAKTITVAGTPSVQAFSPFAPQFQWTPSVIGGSGYFDGTTDYLTGNGQLSSSASMSTFTVEGWLYPTTLGNNFVIGDMDATGATNVLSIRTGNSGDLVLYWYDGATKECYSPNGSLRVNQWNYFAIVVNSNAISMYINSTTAASLTGTTTLTNRTQTSNFAVGQINNAQNYPGYIGSLRWSNGIARTISAIPTAPYTSDANTRLLLNFTNAGIFDGTMKNNLETVGNAQVSTAVVKYGSGSMFFDGTGDYLYLPSNRNLELGTGDFTLECWVYATSAPSDVGIFESRTDGNGATTNGFTITAFSSSVIRIFSGSVLISSSGTSYVNTWCHVAVTRVSGTFNLYINGVSQGTSTTARTLSNTDAVVGGGRYGTTGAVTTSFPGYIDDLRITKGIARYTQNFIPPSVALPRQ
jgi:hypothetical protein